MKKSLTVPTRKRTIAFIWSKYFTIGLLVFSLFSSKQIIDPLRYSILIKIGFAVLLANLLLHVLFRYFPKIDTRLLHLVIIIDVLFISASVIATGGTESPFLYFYFLQLIPVTLLLSHRKAIQTAAFLTFIFYFIYLSQLYGLHKYFSFLSTPSLEKMSWHVRSLYNLLILWFFAVSMAIFSYINEGELKKNNQELSIITEIGVTVEKTLVVEDILLVTLNGVIDYLGYDAVFMVMTEKETGIIKGHSSVGFSKKTSAYIEEINIRPHSKTQSVLLKTVEKRFPILASVESLKSRDPYMAKILEGYDRFVTVPFLGHNWIPGILVAAKKEKKIMKALRWQREDTDPFVLLRLGKQAAIAIENAELHEQMKDWAITDALTGLYNHRFFQEHLSDYLDTMLKNGQLAEQPLSLIILDIDNFKNYNDNNGHVAGDNLLRALSADILKSSRKIDTVARYGGEEFTVILPDTGVDESIRLAERIRLAIEKDNFPNQEKQPNGNLTVSIGVATLQGKIISKESLLKKADKALYFSKENGKNKTTHYGWLKGGKLKKGITGGDRYF